MFRKPQKTEGVATDSAPCHTAAMDPSPSPFLRPAVHFTPPAGWMNDPCGLVYHRGRFHVYYQHNPSDARWGPMHWGHASSEDLFHWRDHPIALTPDDRFGMAFTGTAFHGTGDGAGLRALYTGAVPRGDLTDTLQQQVLASSPDGERWVPETVAIPNPGLRDFRDPAIGRHPDTGRWYCVVAAGGEVFFYSADDPARWRFESRFGAGWGLPGVEWECPDLFMLPVRSAMPDADDDDAVRKWVLITHAGRGLPRDRSGARYIVGSFDGSRFTPEMDDLIEVDGGHDFYAAQTWRDLPGPRRWIAWTGHWAYSDHAFTRPWAGALTLPRELFLEKDVEGGYRLVQKLPPAFASLPREWRGFGGRVVIDQPGATLLRHGGSPGRVELDFGAAGLIRIEIRRDSIRVDRRELDMGSFNRCADLDREVPRTAAGAGGHVDVLVDGVVLEIFADGGRTVITDSIYPRSPLRAVEAVGSDSVAAERLVPTIDRAE